MSAAPVLSSATDRAAWLAARRKHVTATDVAAILGVHPYSSPHRVWLDKNGLLPDQEETDAMWLGTYLEETVAARFTHETAIEVERAGLVVMESEPLFAATPDFYVGDDALLECKTAGQWAGQNFGAEGTDDVPVQYLCQCQWQMMVTGRNLCHLWVLKFSPTRFGRYVVKADPRLQTTMAHQARKWAGEYLTSDNPPPLSGAECDQEWVRLKDPQSDGSVVAATPEVDEWCEALKSARAALAAAEADKETYETRIKGFMGAASVLESSLGKFKWGEVSRTDIDRDKLRLEFPEASEACQKVSTYRRFTTPLRSEKA